MIENKKMDILIKKATDKEISLSECEHLVLEAYSRTKSEYSNAPYIVMKDLVWESQLEEFLKFLCKMDVDKIIIADRSTALMLTLTYLLDNDAEIETSIKIKSDRRFSNYESALIVNVK